MSDTTPTATPPGTSSPGFWEQGGTKNAIATTLGVVLLFADALIQGSGVDRAALSVGLTACAWAWAAAFGIHKNDSDALRWR